MADRWEDYFVPGETLLWEGHPEPRSGFSPGMLGLAIFGLPFLVVGVGLSGGALLAFLGFSNSLVEAAGSLFLFFFGLPFAGAGIGMVFGPWYAARNAHRYIRYALSDRRAYIASNWWSRKMEVLAIAPDAPVSIEAGQSVFFQSTRSLDSDGDTVTKRRGFEHIADAPKVYRLIRQIQDAQDD